jgi:LPPG:FO 2-phospho-L-lactate transferase
VVKGPTEQFMAWAGLPLDAGGIARAYAQVADGLVADEPAGGLPVHVTDTLMADAAARRRVAEETLAFAGRLAAS